MSDWKQRILEVACTKCGAEPEQLCRTTRGHTIDVADSHVARKRAVDKSYTGKRGPVDR